MTVIGGITASVGADSDLMGDRESSPRAESTTRTVNLAQPACTPGALVHSVAASEPIVALTFDDGPWPSATRAVMDALRDHGYEGKATFYMIGVNVQQNPSIAQEVAARGYDIGNHSMTHQYLPQGIANEIGPAQDLIEATTGIRPNTFRSPGLTTGAVIQDELTRQGMCNVFTGVDLGDWRSPRISAAEICAHIHANVRAGDIVLLHEAGGHGPTVQAMQTCVIETLQSMGLSVVSEDELLNGGSSPDRRLPAGEVLEIQASTLGGQAVIGQLTTDQAKGPGYFTAYPCSEERPLASDLNYAAGAANTNLLVARTDSSGKLCVFTSETAHVIYDQVAELDAAVLPLGPAQRVLDTRDDVLEMVSGNLVHLRVAAPYQVVIGQLTTSGASEPGYVTVYPCAEGRGPSSDLNFVAGSATSNRLITRADATGDICLFADAATDLIFDQSAAIDPTWVTPGSVERILDTRTTSPVPAGGTVSVAVGTPGSTVILQLTTDRSQGSGYLTAYPCDQGRPNASSLNFSPTGARSGRVVVQADAAGNTCIYSYAATDLIIDRTGSALWPSHAPTRLADTRIASPFGDGA